MHKRFRIAILIIVLVFSASHAFAATTFVETLTKIRSAKGYIFKVNYSTKDEWTDGLVFKLFCTFSKGNELSFTSAGLNNVRKGWHKTEIRVPKVYRDRYGYIANYRLELYHKGVLIAMRSM